MAFAVCRIQKVKASNLQASFQHNNRQRFTPNADPKKEHICILGQEGVELATLVYERIGKQTIRTNAVLAVEFLLSASADYFRPHDVSEAGYYEPSQLEPFVTTTVQWLGVNWGDRIVLAYLHLDEVTPHIHAYLVPLDEKGKLNCRALFGKRSQLSQLQDSYAQALSHLGIQRGIKGSRATHTQIKQYYTAVTQAPDLALDEAGITHLIADRNRILKQNTEYKRTAQALAKEIGIKDKRIVELEIGVEALKQKLNYLQDKNQDRNSILNQPLVMLVSTHLDALALANLNPQRQNTIYLPLINGEPPYEFLRSMPKDSVFIALNKNPDSEKLAHQIRQQLPKQTIFMRPKSIDWVTELEKASNQKQLGQNYQSEITPNRGVKR
jgi:Plasmid recombination enzyme